MVSQKMGRSELPKKNSNTDTQTQTNACCVVCPEWEGRNFPEALKHRPMRDGKIVTSQECVMCPEWKISVSHNWVLLVKIEAGQVCLIRKKYHRTWLRAKQRWHPPPPLFILFIREEKKNCVLKLHSKNNCKIPFVTFS